MKKQEAFVGYANIDRKEFMGKLRPILSPRDLEMVETAYVLAKYGHRNQMRDSGHVRYFEHPKTVAWILVDELKVADAQTIVMALLHDVLEDSHILSPYRIELNFGKEIVVGLKLLTKQPKDGYLKRLKTYASAKTLIIKLCDRLHNLRTLSGCTKKKQKEQIEESKRYYIPLAEHLVTLLSKKDRWRGEYLEDEIKKICARYE